MFAMLASQQIRSTTNIWRVVMLTIWKNFFFGRNRWALITMCAFCLFQIGVAAFMYPWYVWGPLAIFGFAFALPSAIYLIDQDSIKNPNRPRTFNNLAKIFIGR